MGGVFNDLIIRDAISQDMEAIAAIYNQSITAGGSTMDQQHITPAEMREMWQRYSPREFMIVLTRQEKVLGYGLIKAYSARLGYRYACECAVYLDRSLMGQGLGTLLKKALIERARALDYHHMVSKILADNKASQVHNRKLGFEVVGRQKEIGFVDGRWMDVIIMQLIMEPKKISQ